MRMKETAAAMLPDIPFQFDSQAEIPSARLPLEVRRNIFPVFKEILHNITRHARATRVQILLRSAADRLELTVTDNGVGFVVDQAHSGNGLKNLRRRAGELRGTVQIQSKPGAGTTITLVAPMR